MSKSFILWIIAFLATAGSALYQRVTGPTYPVTIKGTLGGAAYSTTLERSHAGRSSARIAVLVPDSAVRGEVHWKRFRTDDLMTPTLLTRSGDSLIAYLPGQPPAGKLEYVVRLTRGVESVQVPSNEHVVIRFKGDVPLPILVLHVLAMFLGMLFSNRLGLVVFESGAVPRILIFVTVALFVLGGLVLGPIVQKYAFGAYWTGWPFGNDLTDNKTAVAVLAWIAVLVMIGRSRFPRRWILGAALATMAVFMIPHSVLGSELDYRALDNRQVVRESAAPVDTARR
jgi:hypothetical protein